jgi:hypothetical protein
MNDRDKHIHLTLRGSKEKQGLFHWMVHDFDRDWPFQEKTSLLCKVCNGGIWKNPRFLPSQLKILAKQINGLPGEGHLKLKIRSFLPAKICYEKALDAKLKGAEVV